MNMLGMKLAADGLNRAFGSSGRGGRSYYGKPDEQTEEELFLIDCKKIIEGCAQMPSTEGTFIPVTTEHKRTLKQKIRGEKNETTRELFIAKIKKGHDRPAEFEHISGLAKMIGMIDDDKVFIYEEYGSEKTLDIIKFEEILDSGKRSNIMANGYSSTDNDVSMSRTTIRDNDRFSKDSNTLNQRYRRGSDKYIDFALTVKNLHDQAKEKEEANNASEIEME